jgi:hypothetical protein
VDIFNFSSFLFGKLFLLVIMINRRNNTLCKYGHVLTIYFLCISILFFLKTMFGPFFFRREIFGPWESTLWPGYLFSQPVTPNRRGSVSVYQTGSIGNHPILVEFKFQIKFRSSVGLVWYTDRFDRYTSPVQPVTGRWNKKTKSVENLICFKIWIKNWEKEKILKKLQGA